jgi:hypothetical protein
VWGTGQGSAGLWINVRIEKKILIK